MLSKFPYLFSCLNGYFEKLTFWWPVLFDQLNLDRVLARMWEEMGLVRVYTKPQGQQPDFTDPVVLSAVRTF